MSGVLTDGVFVENTNNQNHLLINFMLKLTQVRLTELENFVNKKYK